MEDSTLFCKYIKLANGDNIVALTDDNCINLLDSRVVVVMDPMSVTPIRIPRMNQILESYVLHPWLPLTDSNIAEIQSSHIVSAVEARDTFREQYENFVKQMSEETNEKAEDLTIEEDLHKAQEILKTLSKTNNEEDDEQSDGNWGPINRPIH